jgi:phytoene dehydrogenase-like protein
MPGSAGRPPRHTGGNAGVTMFGPPEGASFDEHRRVVVPIFRRQKARVPDPVAIERYDANYVGGDINGGSSELSQLFFRPVAALYPYATPVPNLFLCSSSTPPGGGVHGMCGQWAARSVLARVFGMTPTEIESASVRQTAMCHQRDGT